MQLVQSESQFSLKKKKKPTVSNSLAFGSVNTIKTHTKIQIAGKDKIMPPRERK